MLIIETLCRSICICRSLQPEHFLRWTQFPGRRLSGPTSAPCQVRFVTTLRPLKNCFSFDQEIAPKSADKVIQRRDAGSIFHEIKQRHRPCAVSIRSVGIGKNLDYERHDEERKAANRVKKPARMNTGMLSSAAVAKWAAISGGMSGSLYSSVKSATVLPSLQPSSFERPERKNASRRRLIRTTIAIRSPGIFRTKRSPWRSNYT